MLTSATVLPVWPPHELTEPERNKCITQDARDYALGHGLVYRALPAEQGGLPPQDVTIHAPTTIVPTPFPRALYEKAQRLQPLFNELYAKVAMDAEFLSTILENSVVKVDDFQRRLYQIWRAVLEDCLLYTSSEPTRRS